MFELKDRNKVGKIIGIVVMGVMMAVFGFLID